MPWQTLLTGTLGKLLKSFMEGIYGIFCKERQKARAEQAEALRKANESVEESLDVEKAVRDKQDEVNKTENRSNVQDEDGGLNFDGFNAGGDR